MVALGLANLVLVSPRLWSSLAAFYATDPGVAALQAEVGGARVGFGQAPSHPLQPSAQHRGS